MLPGPAFFELHRDLPREGPGSPAEVDWVLGLIPPPARVIDAGCGPGADTETLADRLPAARIEAVDITPHFVDEAAHRLARFGARVRVRVGDMRDIEGPADLIWCMGALYFLGVETALAAWRGVLAPGGAVAFSEPVFLSPDPSAAARSFWADYPGVGMAETVAARVSACGWTTRATRKMTGEPWAAYYRPMEARIRRLRQGDVSPELAEVLAEHEREIALWREAPDEVAYLLSVVEPA